MPDPLPNINRVYAMIIQEERHPTIARRSDERGDMVGFSAQIRPTTRVASVRGKEKLGTCGHGGKYGHESNSCYQLIGYLEWWGDSPRGAEKRTEVFITVVYDEAQGEERPAESSENTRVNSD